MYISTLFAAMLFFSCLILLLLASPARAVAQQDTPNPTHVGIVRGGGYAATVLMVIGFVGMIGAAFVEGSLA